jgi:hypothetical protein
VRQSGRRAIIVPITAVEHSEIDRYGQDWPADQGCSPSQTAVVPSPRGIYHTV